MRGCLKFFIKNHRHFDVFEKMGSRTLREEYTNVRLIAVSMDKYKRTMNDVEIFPVTDFLSELWKGKIL